jgi:hypothetical protein
LEDFAALFINAVDETSATITILTWCCADIQFILSRCTTSRGEPRVQTEHPASKFMYSLIAQVLQGVYALKVSSSCSARGINLCVKMHFKRISIFNPLTTFSAFGFGICKVLSVLYVGSPGMASVKGSCLFPMIKDAEFLSEQGPHSIFLSVITSAVSPMQGLTPPPILKGHVTPLWLDPLFRCQTHVSSVLYQDIQCPS